MEQLDYTKLYIKTPMGIKEYHGKHNFASGSIKCPGCGAKMELVPINQTYVRFGNDKILVDNQDGILFVVNPEVESRWMCTGVCKLSIMFKF